MSSTEKPRQMPLWKVALIATAIVGIPLIGFAIWLNVSSSTPSETQDADYIPADVSEETSEPEKSVIVTYEVIGTAEVADILITDTDGIDRTFPNMPLPWERTYENFESSAAWVEAIIPGGSVTVNIYVNGRLYRSKTDNYPSGATTMGFTS